MKKKQIHAAVAAALAFAPAAAFATNGMNLEGYGAIATGVGGASMAYDNGTAAVMNNPATLGLAPEGSRLDLALGMLGPDVQSSMPGMPAAKSSADAFYMPAVGWARKADTLTYGVGLFSQGGMGTEYSGDSFLAAGSGETVRAEVGVGRLILPLAYSASSDINVAASLDYVWAGMDLKMALSGAQFFDMAGALGGSQTYGSVEGSMVTTFGGMMPMLDPANPVNWGRFDFSNDSDFSGEAKGDGIAGKLGATFKVSSDLSLGAAYHSATALSDLETDNATVTFNANVDTGVASGGAPSGTYAPMSIPVTGDIKVRDFEWPQMVAFGAAFKASDALSVMADYKWIDWSSAMKNFKMTFTADSTQANPMAASFAGQSMDATMYQNWEDQHVFMVGAAYKLDDAFTLRGGANIANNPVPDKYMNPLFPAIIKNHVTIGAGYAMRASSIDAAVVYAPEVSVTNGQGVTTTHSQTSAQLLYTHRF